MGTPSRYPWDLPLFRQNIQASGAAYAAPLYSGRWVGAPIASLRRRILRPGSTILHVLRAGVHQPAVSGLV